MKKQKLVAALMSIALGTSTNLRLILLIFKF